MASSGTALARVGGWVLALILASPLVGLGQEPRSEPPVRSAPESGPKLEMDEPAEEPDVVPPKRRLFKRLGPQPVTPEQREEAERLRILAAKYGTDPTAIVGRMQLSSAYNDLAQGARASDTIARVDLPFRKDFLLRVDAPFLKWSDPDRPGATSMQGFSDLAVTAGWRAYNTPEYALLVGVVSTMPTAAETGLGLGKYTVGPTIATARFLPQWESFLIGLFTQQVSIGGDPARKALNLSRLTAQINSFWAGRWWSIAQTVWQIDWERNAKGSLTLELEVGRSVVGRWGVYARPGIGVFGRDLIGAYDWNVEAGVRYMFPSF
ncbi:hypothetical protein ACO9S2_02095 [Nitrospira sp. NS4]|uniref:hypothetical protein n=1 Tax=Nitrospira sp. NS4 TaxID=3414498 RepID=UPI003C2C0868